MYSCIKGGNRIEEELEDAVEASAFNDALYDDAGNDCPGSFEDGGYYRQ